MAASQSSIGQDLARARTARRLSLHDLSVRTKIAVPRLQQIERGDLSELPSGIYVRAMLRAVAREVGCDPEAIVSRYAQESSEDLATGGAPSHPAYLVTGDDGVPRVHAAEIDALDRRRSGFQRIAVAALLLLGGAAYAWSNGNVPNAWSWLDAIRAHAAAVVATTIAPAPPSDAALVEARTTDAPVVQTPAADTPIADPPIAVATNGAQSANELRVGLDADGPCWLSGTADGERVIYRTLNAGEHADVRAVDLVLRVGDPSAVRVSVNGAAIRPVGRPGVPVTVHFTPQNYRDWVQP